jgi:hypothetical protein
MAATETVDFPAYFVPSQKGTLFLMDEQPQVQNRQQQNLVRSMYFFENGRFVIFTSVDVLKPDVLQPNVLKTWRFEDLTFCKPDVL